jgi:hypothetical protein
MPKPQRQPRELKRSDWWVLGGVVIAIFVGLALASVSETVAGCILLPRS